MIQLISLILTLGAVLMYFKLKKNANKKYGDSVTFQIIDREYSKWYKKRGNGAVINKNTTSMFEVDKVIWVLRKSLGEQGVTKEQLDAYLIFLESDSPKEYGLKGIIVTLLSYFGIQNLLNDMLSNVFPKDNVFNFKGLSDKLSQASAFYSKNTEQIQIGIFLILLISVIYLLIRVMYSIVNMDNLHKNSQRIFVLKRVKEIWEFSENAEIETLQEVVENSKENKKLIYIKLPSSLSTINEEMNKAIGNSVEYNFQYFAKYKLLSWINLSAVREWILGEIVPSLFNSLTMFLSFFAYSILSKQGHYIMSILMIAPTMLLIYMYFIFYFSQLDKLEDYNQDTKVKMEEAKKFIYKLEPRGIKKVRTWIAIFSQLLITIVSTVIFLISDKFSFVFPHCFIFFPIILIGSTTIFGIFKKVTKSTQV